jgi:predicted CXXCH cytochrome family protein
MQLLQLIIYQPTSGAGHAMATEASQNFNFTPNRTLLNVSQHYWNGTNITTSSITTNNATFYVSSFNNTIYNHTSRATTPLCTTCHNNGRIHNSTLSKPVSNDSFCSTCHGPGGSAATNNKTEHKTLYCTECHSNSSTGTLAGKDIHSIKYLTQSNTFSTSNSSAVTCVTCHQTTIVNSSLGGFSPVKIQNPLHHSDNASNGT